MKTSKYSWLSFKFQIIFPLNNKYFKMEKCPLTVLVLIVIVCFIPSIQILVTQCPGNCISCDDASNTTCLVCHFGYKLNTNNACDKIPCIDDNCALCNDIIAHSCYNCVDGYYAISTHTCDLCYNAIPSCSTCSYSNSPTVVCNSCIIGYYLVLSTCSSCYNV